MNKLVTRPPVISTLLVAVFAGFLVFAALSFITQGLIPFLEFAVAGAVVYLIARR